MRRFVKRMAAAVLLSACLVSLSGCSSNQDTAETDSTISMDGTPVDDSMAQSIMLSAAQTLGVPKDQLIVQKTLAESTGDATTAAIYEAQLEVREDMGELKNVNMDEGSVVLLADGSYTVMIPVDFTEGTKKYVMNINMATQQIQAEFTDMSAGVAEDTSMGTLLKTATVYTIIGIGTVFLVLIFISILISCFKYIHAWEEGKKKAAAPALKAAPVPAAAPAGAAGSVQVTAPMPGKVVAVKASVGQAVKKGEVVLVLEAMKMENDIVAPEDGTIASINVANGDAVESGAVLANVK